MAQLHASLSSITTPDTWIHRTPSTAASSADLDATSAALEEVWQEDAIDLDLHSKQRAQLLRLSYGAFRIVEEKPLERSDSLVAQRLVVSYEDEDFQPFRHREVFFRHGPLLCTLTLIGPEGRDPRRDAIFDEIERSFQLTNGNTLSEQPFQLFATTPLKELAALDQTATECPTIILPYCCMKLPIPHSFDRRQKRSTTILSNQRTHITIRRLLGAQREPTHWLRLHLGHAQSNARPLGWGTGSLDGIGDWTGLLVDEIDDRRWKTSFSQRTLWLLTSSPEPMEWSVSAKDSSLTDLETALAPFLASRTELDAQYWKTLPNELWLNAELQGPWTSTVDGLYLKEGTTTSLLQLRIQSLKSPLEVFLADTTSALAKAVGASGGLDRLDHPHSGTAHFESTETGLRAQAIYASDPSQVYCAEALYSKKESPVLDLTQNLVDLSQIPDSQRARRST